MHHFLNRIRPVENRISIKIQIGSTAGVLIFGIILGILSKYLDCTASNRLPFILRYLDISNFLGRFPIWIFLAICISVYSVSPSRAAVNVLAFFTGMVTSYYLYSKFIAGFFPKSYAMIWVGFTALSPLLAFICWYAKGSGKISLTISAGMIAVLFNMTFLYGWIYFDVRSPLELLVFLGVVWIVRRRTVRETIIMMAAGTAFAFFMASLLPFRFG